MKYKTIFLLFHKIQNPFLLLFKNSIFKWILAIVCILNLAQSASIGQNAWRDAQTFGVALNFIEEKSPFLQPSYDIRTSDDGRLPGEFPLQSYYCSLFMKMTSATLFYARLSNFMLGLATAAFLFFIGKKIGNSVLGLITVACFVSNPLVGSQMVSVMPETMVNLLCTLSIFCYLYVKEINLKWMLAIFLISICTLVKPSGFVAITFIIVYDYLKNGFQLKAIVFYLFLIIIPVFCLKLWIAYTLQFESNAFAYPITHHYVRTVSDTIKDFGTDVFLSALEKTFRHSFNVIGILGIILVAFLSFKKSLSAEIKPWMTACAIWILGGIAFLIYAGSVQTVQLYYATPLIIPAIFIGCQVFNYNVLFRFMFLLILLLQSNIKLNTFNENYLENKSEWESFRLEKTTDTFSTRKDPFIVYPFATPDFAMLGRMGRRGFNSESTEIFANKNHYFRYVCLTDASKKADILAFIEDKLLASYAGKEFYKLK